MVESEFPSGANSLVLTCKVSVYDPRDNKIHSISAMDIVHTNLFPLVLDAMKNQPKVALRDIVSEVAWQFAASEQRRKRID